MIVKKKTFSYWYVILVFSFITVLVWFFVEVSATKEIRTVSKEAQEAAKSLPASFNLPVVEELQQRQVISDVDLEDIPPYTENTKQALTGLASQKVASPSPDIEESEVEESTPSSEPVQ
ncbi:MAG: hypothetical protein ACOX6V_02365 [Patescibacteria group bacterium]|jgi:hypothetical protein